jgi:hypothetical protein
VDAADRGFAVVVVSLSSVEERHDLLDLPGVIAD